VVLPCLDEEASVGLCVARVATALAAAGIAHEVIVVDNGSHDRSGAVARAAGARVIRESRPGYGHALLAGITAARAEVVVMADADATYPLERVIELVGPALAGDADLVLGSRLDPTGRRAIPFLHRRVGGPVLTRLVQRASDGLPVRDSQTGFRAFRKSAIAALDLQASGMEFASEMLIRASHAGLRVVETTTGYAPRMGRSKLNTFADGWRHLQLIMLLAPHLFLIGPGAALVTAGIVLTALGLVHPAGVSLGSLQWQPVFFSSIALVLGVQAVLAGAVVANRSRLMSLRVQARFRAVGTRGFLDRLVNAGSAAIVVGLAVDGFLFVAWVTDHPPYANGLALAALAQSLIMCGASITTFGFLARLNLGGVAGERWAPDPQVIDLRDGQPSTLQV
jgi:hypothetical protein